MAREFQKQPLDVYVIPGEYAELDDPRPILYSSFTVANGRENCEEIPGRDADVREVLVRADRRLNIPDPRHLFSPIKRMTPPLAKAPGKET